MISVCGQWAGGKAVQRRHAAATASVLPMQWRVSTPHRCVTDAVGYRTVGSTRLEGVEMKAKARGTRVGRAGSPGRTTTAWRVSARCTCSTAPSPRARWGVLRHAPGEDLIRTRVIALLRHRRAPAHLRHLVRHQVLVHLEGVGARVRVRVTRCTKVYQGTCPPSLDPSRSRASCWRGRSTRRCRG